MKPTLALGILLSLFASTSALAQATPSQGSRLENCFAMADSLKYRGSEREDFLEKCKGLSSDDLNRISQSWKSIQEMERGQVLDTGLF